MHLIEKWFISDFPIIHEIGFHIYPIYGRELFEIDWERLRKLRKLEDLLVGNIKNCYKPITYLCVFTTYYIDKIWSNTLLAFQRNFVITLYKTFYDFVVFWRKLTMVSKSLVKFTTYFASLVLHNIEISLKVNVN